MSVKKMSHSLPGRAWFAVILTALWSLPSLALAQTAPDGQLPSDPAPLLGAPEFSWWGYIQAILVMLAVLLALWGVVWLLRRSGRLASMPRGTLPRDSLFVEGQLSLAPRKGLVVVRFLNRRLVLGVTESQISLLTELTIDAAQPSFTECLDRADASDSA